MKAAALITLAWFGLWLVGLLVAGLLLAGCTPAAYRRTAEFCEALSPVLRAMSGCLHG